MIEFLFLDLDDTILDFQKAERIALAKTLQSFGLEPEQEVLARYHLINKGYWERLERKEVTREALLVDRFGDLFAEYGIAVEPAQCARAYEKNLGTGHYFLPGAREAVEALSRKYKLYLASNGTSHVQAGRIESADIARFFQGIFISQEIGVNKPDIEYFNRCFARIPGFDRAKAMIVGDSLSSDILGGKQAGILTCWVNSYGKPCPGDLRPNYEIKALSELESLLDNQKL
ncbi:MAG: YjjG family noncanonical pyrimidine nucleotidase [Oscillospiraceae bacterium]|nr:YjjG family noncanonical pyrimidine nucleotidase [Oscillospiraceae bacterium]